MGSVEYEVPAHRLLRVSATGTSLSTQSHSLARAARPKTDLDELITAGKRDKSSNILEKKTFIPLVSLYSPLKYKCVFGNGF